MKRALVLMMVMIPALSFAAAEDDYDGLGGNKILLERAKALNPDENVSIVQSRTVSLRNRFEIAPEYSGTFGGDTYTRTQTFGLNVHYHINPQWSIGAKYGMSFNRLTPEGQAMMDRAMDDYNSNPKNPTSQIPDIDYPKSETMAMVTWAPIYGKLNFFDAKVVQFDTYLLAGMGQVALKSGNASSTTAGLGIGFWLSPKLSTRVEMRYQGYEAQYLTRSQKLDLAVASVQMGWLL